MAVYSVLDLTELKKRERWDAEYFQPDNLRKAELLTRSNPVPIDSFALVTDGIHASPEWVQSDGVRYLSAMCVKDNFITLDGVGFISREQDKFSPRTRARVGDVLVTAVGTIGNAAVVENYILPANMDRHLDIIRLHNPAEVDPYYLSTFLNCEFGRFQTVRESTGNVQLNLFIQKLKNVLVPLGRRFEKAGELTRSACRDLEKARELYPEAEVALLQRMGWGELDNQPHELCYVRDFETLGSAGRMDAEHFQPQYRRLRQQLQRHGAELLGNLWLTCEKGTQPEDYSESGEVTVVKSKNVFGEGINLEDCERAGNQAWEDEHARLKEGDLVINSTGRGTLGRAGVVPTCPPRVVASVDLLICRLNKQKITPHYASLFLISPAGLAQSDQFQTGSSGQLHLYPQHIAQFLIFLPRTKTGQIDLAWQETLAAKVETAALAKIEAREKLDAAKRLVEAAVALNG